MNNGTATLRPRGTLWAHLGDEQAERVWGKCEDPGLAARGSGRPSSLTGSAAVPKGERGKDRGRTRSWRPPSLTAC